jgi:S1-C subfamily serine protease
MEDCLMLGLAPLGLARLLPLLAAFFAPAPFWPPESGGAYLGTEFAGNDLTIKTVFISSAALKAGLTSSDRIVSFDGKDVRAPAELGALLKKKKPGDVVSLKVQRFGEEVTVKVALDAPFRPYLGISFNGDNLRVVEVVPGAPADRAGVRSGDVAQAVDDQKVATPEELVGELKAKRAGGVVVLTMQRKGEEMKVKIKLGKRPGY